jgi:hypothetical protein
MNALYIVFLFLALVAGYVLYPFTFKYLKTAFFYLLGEFVEFKEDAEDKLSEIEKVIEKQVNIGKEKGEDISDEMKDMLEDAKQIWNIIKR